MNTLLQSGFLANYGLLRLSKDSRFCTMLSSSAWVVPSFAVSESARTPVPCLRIEHIVDSPAPICVGGSATQPQGGLYMDVDVEWLV